MESVQQEIKTAPMNKRYKRESVEEVDKEIEELEAQRNQEEAEPEENLEPEEKTFKKRYGDLRRHSQQLQEQHSDEIRKLQEQVESLTRKQVKLPKTDEELEEWTEKYPDVAKIVETIATKKAVEARKDVEEKLKYVDELKTKVQLEKAESELEKLHPDFAEIRADQEFHDWVAEQPKWIQSALYENDNDPRAAAKAIDLYKLETKKTSKTKSNKDAAKAVSKTSRSSEPANQDRNVWSESRVKGLSSQDWDKFEEAISESVRNGTFVYDLTAGAR
jgi:DNA repair exonuclease SbcCD ATPase subunit|tara:strand:- start:218 stop:1045 length:828 start_codon:yes stop_codon:yes gene_type:complete